MIKQQRFRSNIYTFISIGAAGLVACLLFAANLFSTDTISYGYSPVHPGTASPAPSLQSEYRSYVTPGADAIQALAGRAVSIEDAYEIANRWLYVPEQAFYGNADTWLSPSEFLTKTPAYTDNPLPGTPAGDCEEQANTLVSLLRAMGISPEEVRVVLGKVASGAIDRGHVWVEIYINNVWLPLDPSQGSYWDVGNNVLIRRQGLPFFHYESHPYPVPGITAYYNDIYYMEAGTLEGDFPELWLVSDKSREN